MIEDNNWFSSPGKSDYRETIKNMDEWNVWAPVSFEDNCDECFDGGMNVRINSQDDLISLPASVSEVTSKVECVN